MQMRAALSTMPFLLRLSSLLAVVSLAMLPIVALADDEVDPNPKQAGEDQWVPSLALTAGVTFQNQYGKVASAYYEGLGPDPVPLRDPANGDDTAVSPFVGVTLELMTPALPVKTRPRFFVSGEILPTFASSRDLALEGDPDCVKGPEPNVPCAVDETGTRDQPFGQDSINGQGSRTSAQIDTMVYGANLGVSFPLRYRKRQIRIKPSVAWINYKVKAAGQVLAGLCDPADTCTDWQQVFPNPIDPNNPIIINNPGFIRAMDLTATDSRRFNGIGPGLDIEIDTGVFGPIGSSIFIGGRAYAILGDRTMNFSTSEVYDDQIGNDRATAAFEVEVDPWMYRANVGVRFQWLGGNPLQYWRD